MEPLSVQRYIAARIHPCSPLVTCRHLTFRPSWVSLDLLSHFLVSMSRKKWVAVAAVYTRSPVHLHNFCGDFPVTQCHLNAWCFWPSVCRLWSRLSVQGNWWHHVPVLSSLLSPTIYKSAVWLSDLTTPLQKCLQNMFQLIIMTGTLLSLTTLPALTLPVIIDSTCCTTKNLLCTAEQSSREIHAHSAPPNVWVSKLSCTPLHCGRPLVGPQNVISIVMPKWQKKRRTKYTLELLSVGMTTLLPFSSIHPYDEKVNKKRRSIFF